MATTHKYTDKDGLEKFGKHLAADYRGADADIAQALQSMAETCNSNFNTLSGKVTALEGKNKPWLEVTADGLYNTLMTSGEDYTLDISQYVPANAKLSDYCGVKITDTAMGIVLDCPYIATIGENQAFLEFQQAYKFTLLPAIDLTEKSISFTNLTREIHENANRISELENNLLPWFEISPGIPLDGVLVTTADNLQTYSLSVDLPDNFFNYSGIKILSNNGAVSKFPLLHEKDNFYSFGIFEDSNKNLWKVNYDLSNKKLEFNLIKSSTAIKHAVWFNARSQSVSLNDIANKKTIEFTVDAEEMKAMFDSTLEQIIYADGGVDFPPMPLTPAMMPMLFLTFDAGTVNTFYRFDFIGSHSAYIFFKGDIITEFGIHETYKATWIYGSTKISFECIS